MAHIVVDARLINTSSGRYTERLLHYLQQIDKDNDYTVLLAPNDFDGWHATNPKFKKLVSPYKKFSFGEQYGLVWQLYGLRVDLAHFTMTQQPVLYFGKTVTTINDLTTLRFRNPAKNRLIFGFKKQVYKLVIKWVARKSAYVLTFTKFVKHDVAQYTKIPKDKIFAVYLAADKITEPAELITELNGQKFIMYVGRPLPHKNLWRLIEAFVIIKRTHPDLRLVLAGKKDALFERIERKVQKQAINDVIFTGFVSEGQLRGLYEHTSAYIFPSLSEGFGLPGLEAMIQGAPVVSSDATCLPEIYGQAAHYFDPLDVADMAAKITEVIDNPELRARLVAAGHKQAAKYSWETTARKTLKVYKDALSKS